MSEIILSETEIKKMIELASVINVSPNENPDLFCNQSKKLSLCIPDRIRTILIDFAKCGSPTGFLLIKSIPVDDMCIGPTPPDNTHLMGGKTELAKVQSLFIHTISEMISYEAEGYGQLFQDIVPNKTMSQNQTSLGSHTELEIHTEQAFSDLRPDFLSLACLRSDPDAYTHIFPVKSLVDGLTETDKCLLREPLWKTGVDLSFKLHEKEFIKGDVRGPFPIIYGDVDDPLLIFDQDLMEGITDSAHEIVKKIVDVYYERRIRHRLMPGEIIILDNRRAVHGRSPFFPRFDGKDRFLIRCFSRVDYDSTLYARPDNGRMISAIYS